MAARRTTMAAVRLTVLAVPVAALLTLGLGAGQAMAAEAPVGMLTNEGVAVLASSTVTNTGPSLVTGDLDLSPGSAVDGVAVTGTIHIADPVAVLAQTDLTASIGDANSRATSGPVPTDLTGLTLTPGVYDGAALGLAGTLRLDGDANSVFIFRSTSTLTMANNSVVELVGGATSCNVWWVVPDSATLGTDSVFVGTIMAGVTITANTNATIEGRLLASTGAVNLDSNQITAPSDCAARSVGGTGGSNGPNSPVGGSGSGSGSTSATATGTTATLAATGATTVPLGLPLGLLAAGVMLLVLRGRRQLARHRR